VDRRASGDGHARLSEPSLISPEEAGRRVSNIKNWALYFMTPLPDTFTVLRPRTGVRAELRAPAAPRCAPKARLLSHFRPLWLTTSGPLWLTTSGCWVDSHYPIWVPATKEIIPYQLHTLGKRPRGPESDFLPAMRDVI
jgi:hypothetical protein